MINLPRILGNFVLSVNGRIVTSTKGREIRMFCPKCGKQMPEDATFCLSGGAQLQAGNDG